MNPNLKKRLVSGERVVCRCSLTLPKLNPFSGMRAARTGYVVINVRGCNLYIPQQLTPESIKDVFPPGKPAIIKNFCLYPDDNAVIELGNLQARFIQFRQGDRLTGAVLRFVNLSEEQMDTLNQLTTQFPLAGDNEELSIPIGALHKI